MNQEYAEKMMNMRRHPLETQVWAGQGMYRKKNVQKERLFLLTNCTFYIFSKEKKIKSHFKIVTVASIYDFIEAGFSRTDDLLVKFSTGLYAITIPDPQQFLRAIYTQHKILLWNTNPDKAPGFANPNGREDLEISKKRPKGILTLRYVAACIARNSQPIPQIVEMFTKYDENPSNTMTFSKIDSKEIGAVFLALSMETGVKELTFDNFCPSCITSALSFIFINPSSVSQLTLKKYNSGTFAPMKAKRSTYNNFGIIRIESCSEEFVMDLIESFRPMTFSLDRIIFDGFTFSRRFQVTFTHALEDYGAFTNLISLTMLNCLITDGEFRSFATDCIQTKPSIKHLQLENDHLDVPCFLADLFLIESELQTLILRNNTCEESSTISGELPSKLLYLDISNCPWTVNAFIDVIGAICASERLTPLTLHLKNCNFVDSNTGWADALSSMSLSTLKIVITELDATGNEFNDESFEIFLNFMNTQYPLFSKNPYRLRYLGLSKCFTDEHYEKVMDELQKFLEMRDLWGLDISFNCSIENSPILAKFVSKLSNVNGLTAIDLSANKIDKDCAQSILQFITDSKSIAEVSIDLTGMDNPDTVSWFYQSLVVNPHVLALKTPISDMKLIPAGDALKRTNKRLAMKRSYSNFAQRIGLYLSLSGDYTTRFVTFNQDIITTASDPLFETHFLNPLPNLFAILAQPQYDNVDVVPIAQVVTEYVATSGKYGVVPPTVAPTDTPRKAMLLPPIFASMELQEEADITDIGASLMDIDLTDICIETSAKVRRDMAGQKKKHDWTNPAECVALPPPTFR